MVNADQTLYDCYIINLRVSFEGPNDIMTMCCDTVTYLVFV